MHKAFFFCLCIDHQILGSAINLTESYFVRRLAQLRQVLGIAKRLLSTEQISYLMIIICRGRGMRFPSASSFM